MVRAIASVSSAWVVSWDRGKRETKGERERVSERQVREHPKDMHAKYYVPAEPLVFGTGNARGLTALRWCHKNAFPWIVYSTQRTSAHPVFWQKQVQLPLTGNHRLVCSNKYTHTHIHTHTHTHTHTLSLSIKGICRETDNNTHFDEIWSRSTSCFWGALLALFNSIQVHLRLPAALSALMLSTQGKYRISEQCSRCPRRPIRENASEQSGWP